MEPPKTVNSTSAIGASSSAKSRITLLDQMAKWRRSTWIQKRNHPNAFFSWSSGPTFFLSNLLSEVSLLLLLRITQNFPGSHSKKSINRRNRIHGHVNDRDLTPPSAHLPLRRLSQVKMSLANLPVLCWDLIFKELSFRDIVSLFFTSKSLSQYVSSTFKSWRKFKKMLAISWTDNELKFELEMNVMSTKIEVLFNEDGWCEAVTQMFPGRRQLFNMPCTSVDNAMQTIAQIFVKQFDVSEIVIIRDEDRLIDLGNLLKINLENVKKVTLRIRNLTKEEFKNFCQFDWPPLETLEVTFRGEFEVLPLDKICAERLVINFNSDWFKIEALETMEVRHMETPFINIGSVELNTFLVDWQNGHYTNVVTLKLGLPDIELDLFGGLSSLTYADAVRNYGKGDDLMFYKEDWCDLNAEADGFHMQRKDGKIATVYLDYEIDPQGPYFFFVVWTASLPYVCDPAHRYRIPRN